MRLGLSSGLSHSGSAAIASGLPPVANTKSLNFDGTNDHLVTQVDSTAQPNNESRYYSWWLKTSGGAQRIWDHGDTTKGAFQLNNGNKPLLYMATTVYQYWEDNSAQDDGNWHHWVVEIKFNDLTGCELWIDGIKQTKSSIVNEGSMDSYTTGLRIGRGGDSYFNGSIDEFSIHEDLDEEAISALFNSGRPIDISSNHGAYTYSDNLLHWWRMGDATSPAADGTSNLLFDQGPNGGLGSELITNGTFDSNVTSWPSSSGGTVTWSSGTAITGAVGTDDRGGMSQTFTTVNGAVYQLSFDVISRTSTKWEVYRQGTGAGTIIEGTDLGSHSTFFTAAATSTELAFYAKQAGTSDGTVAWDNISVKQVNGAATMTNMDSGDIEEDTP